MSFLPPLYSFNLAGELGPNTDCTNEKVPVVNGKIANL